MLLPFREMYDEVPYFNTHGVAMKLQDEFDYFSESRLRAILEDLA